MSDKTNAYGGGSSDTSFRKTWDRAKWAAKAAEREAAERVESKARYEAKAVGKKYHAPAPDDAEMISARRERINFTENLNKTTLVPAGAGVGKRGRSAGFYCEACDLTFKDSLQWVDHLNSKQHLHATGRTGEVVKATLEEVLARLEWLKERARREREEGDGGQGLQERIEKRQREEERERAEKREKRKEQRRRKMEAEINQEEGVEKGKDVVGVDDDEAGEEDDDSKAMAAMMGFSGGFGTTKKKN